MANIRESVARPEMPFLLAGALAFVGGAAKAEGWPRNGHVAVIATGVLVVVASLANGTSFGPLVRAIGLLTVLVAAMAAITEIDAAAKRRKKD